MAVIQGRRVAVEVRPFEMYHLDLLRAQGVQGSQFREVSIVPGSYATLPAPVGPAVTAFDGTRLILCGGISITAPKKGQCWALLSNESGRHMHFLHRAVQRFITMHQWVRLEATVEEGFKPACRWVELLGFEYEGRLKNYGLRDETHLIYART